MSFDKLRNCPRCGELFVYQFKDYCQKCVKKVEDDFQKCSQFLRNKENRQSTITEMSQKTGVSVDQISEFIREKRLVVDHFPQMGFPCESCGATIRNGRLCDACANTWKKTIEDLETKPGNNELQPKRGGGYYYKKE